MEVHQLTSDLGRDPAPFPNCTAFQGFIQAWGGAPPGAYPRLNSGSQARPPRPPARPLLTRAPDELGVGAVLPGRSPPMESPRPLPAGRPSTSAARWLARPGATGRPSAAGRVHTRQGPAAPEAAAARARAVQRARTDLPAPHPGAAASSLRRPAPRPRPPPVSPSAAAPHPRPPPATPAPGGSRGRGGGPRTRARPRPSAARPPRDRAPAGAGEEPAAGASCGQCRAPQPAADSSRIPRRGAGPRPPLLENLGGRCLGARRHPPAGQHSPSLGSLLCARSWAMSCRVGKGLDPKTSFLGFTLSAYPKGRPPFGPSLQPQPSPSPTPPPPRKGAFPSCSEHSLTISSLPLPSIYCLGECTPTLHTCLDLGPLQNLFLHPRPLVFLSLHPSAPLSPVLSPDYWPQLQPAAGSSESIVLLSCQGSWLPPSGSREA